MADAPRKRTPPRKENAKAPKRKPSLAEQSLDDMIEFLERQAGLSALLCVTDDDGVWMSLAQPSPVAAVNLIPAVLGWQEFQPPEEEEVKDRTNLAKSVQLRLEEMSRRNCRFTMIWHIAGDKTVHTQTSNNYGGNALNRDLIDAVQNELSDFLPGLVC